MQIAQSTLNSIKDTMQENLNILEDASTFSALHIQEKYIKDADIRFSKLENTVNNNSLQIELHAQFFGIINTILFISQKHEKFQSKLNLVYNGEIQNRLFEIIDYMELSKTIKTINERLKPDFTIAKIKLTERNNFIETYSEINETHLTISIDVPIIDKTRFNLFEIIPTPIKENNALYILNIKTAKYYVKNQRVHLVTEDALRTLCKSQDNTIICNYFLENYTEEPSNCIRNLIMNNTDVDCEYKKIQYKNYFIEISKTLIHAHCTYSGTNKTYEKLQGKK